MGNLAAKLRRQKQKRRGSMQTQRTSNNSKNGDGQSKAIPRQAEHSSTTFKQTNKNTRIQNTAMGNLAAKLRTKGKPGRSASIKTHRSSKSGNDQQSENTFKLLLLGAGESGKTTILKQMRFLHGEPLSSKELEKFKSVIRSNVITAIRKLMGLLSLLGLEGELSDNEKEAFMHLTEEFSNLEVRATLNVHENIMLEHWQAIQTLWSSEVMMHVWLQRAACNVIDGHKLFLDNISRIASTDYSPTSGDILLARERTYKEKRRIHHVDGANFEFYDVGGQRGARREWIKSFNRNVDAVIFVVALSEYDQMLNENRRTNRMVESIELFKSVCNNAAFANKPVMLFLNKKDVFADKIVSSDIGAQPPFRDYTGRPGNFDDGVEYFVKKFMDCLFNPENHERFVHVTNATDPSNMLFVLNSTRWIVMRENIESSFGRGVF
eukprot:CAMPEP_0116037022 /NCGR_PEP_ID=MMETSP0321-20121206/21679_1 /TAXON_ID=163516 /ORGANISM="Leptocylindrus danicus var. danicus, Strain B650" /LENGTH=435 /DNA_ID=CAMNT_0003514893 /DNA_START=59 /DNA_END=1366 /DNA_ORIENTATION=-